MLADCQSFYASVEKAEHPEYQDRPLVVAGDPERRSGIVLAACPKAKEKGVKTAERLGEAMAKCPELVVIKPRMQRYIDVSMKITDIYKSFTDLVEPYSIDEQFLDVTGSLHLYGCTPEELARMIQNYVQEATGVYTRFGIADSKILAKMACDNYGKKSPSGIYTLSKDHLDGTLWKLPVSDMFMAGSRMTRHFMAMGLPTIGSVARTPLAKLKQMMRRKFGRNSDIQAELYWRIANGIDDSPVRPGTHQVDPKSVGHMMTLPRDYGRLEEIKVVLLELTELVCQRCRGLGFMGHVVSVHCTGADFDRPSGFSRQMKMDDPSNVTNQVYRWACRLLEKHWDGLPVRQVGISLSQLTPDQEYQLSLFDMDREKWMALERTTDALKRKYGDAIIIRAVSMTEAGQALDRSTKIGGHYR
ncbi:DNA polymerase IV [Paenibacillus sp. 7541]|uniref:DNA polymerase IV n=2 Tax=Paenibacillus TaxID=44249 RepID=A0A268F3J8_9BACL|nr:DNA polymerase IV [Paenibacillus campinasensis]PAD79956.1 DNA polymerase IV [Paenibacillus campinasensis]PAK55574.1 DNA polymerase IV [Paenibacillus sp. 7541]